MVQKTVGIYCIENMIDGKKYIGLSRNIERRWNEHCFKLRRGKHANIYLQRAWDKYGQDAFKFYIIEICDEKLLSEREEYYISKEHTLSHDSGYNLTKGGEDAPTTSRKIISYHDDMVHNSVREAAKCAGVSDITMITWCKKCHNFMYLDEWNNLNEKEREYWRSFNWEMVDHARLSEAHSRCNLKEETLLKNSNATRGARNPRAFAVYCPELNESFWGAQEAHEKYGVCSSSISQCINGKIKHAGKHPVTGEPLTWVKI